MSRTLTTFTLLGVVASVWLLWTFDHQWPDFDKWDRVLAVLLVLAVWACVAACVATVRQAFKRYPRTLVEEHEPADEPQGMEVLELGVVVPDARGEFDEALVTVVA